MRIKSYFADSVQEAIEKARVELGPDAMLMNSKKTDFELRSLGTVEVVFGLPGQAAVSKSRLQLPAVPAGTATGPPAAPSLAGLEAAAALPADMASELSELRRQIETVKRSVHRQQRGGETPAGASRAVENLSARLTAAGLSEDLAQEIAEAAELQAFASKQIAAHGIRDFDLLPAELLELALTTELERRLEVLPELGKAGFEQKLVVFAGPAGAGKTTALIKLGLRCGLQARLPMHILSLDTLRVGGWEPLAAFARIAGLGFDAVHNLNALDQFLSEHASKKLILIDTPPFGPAESEDLAALAQWLGRTAHADVQLVMPATLRTAVFTRTVERFLPLRPAKLLLTQTDEVECPGMLVDLALRAKLPLSYLSNGHSIPEDIEQAMKASLLSGFTNRPALLYRKEAA